MQKKTITIKVNGQRAVTVRVKPRLVGDPEIEVDSKLDSEAIGRAVLLGLLALSAKFDEEDIDLFIDGSADVKYN